MEKPTKLKSEGLLKHLRCPRCKEYMVPPISFCENGHNICKSCRPKASRCVSCQEPYLRGRNLTLEAIVLQVAYPCMFKSKGCKECFPLLALLDHQDSCLYGTFNCPVVLVGRNRCSWKSCLSEMRDHFLSSHKDDVWEGTGAYIRKKGGVSSNGLYNEVIITFGEIFYVQFRGQDKSFYGFVKYIGPKENAKQYTSTISVFSKDGTEMITARFVTSDCKKDNEDIIAHGKCLKLHYDVVRKFLHNEGSMYTKVEISRIVRSEPLNDRVGI